MNQFQDDGMSQEDYNKTISELPQKQKAPEFPGRPKNRGVIKREDIMNLKIALNIAKSIEEFVGMV